MIQSGDNPKIWKCQKCPTKYSSDSIDKIVTTLDEEKNNILGDPSKKKVAIIEKFIKKCASKLDGRNLIIVRLKYNLIGLYGREPGYTTEVEKNWNIFRIYEILFKSSLKEMTEADWNRKREICEEIMYTLKVKSVILGKNVTKKQVLHVG